MWFVTANTNSCRIFQYEKADKKLTLVKELSNPLAKMKGSDLVSDRPGHYGGNGSNGGHLNGTGGYRGAYVSATDPQEAEVEQFSLEIAKELEKGRVSNAYRELILAAQPHMSGCINKRLDGHVKDCILHNVVKDYTRLNERELLTVLKEL